MAVNRIPNNFRGENVCQISQLSESGSFYPTLRLFISPKIRRRQENICFGSQYILKNKNLVPTTNLNEQNLTTIAGAKPINCLDS